MVSELRSNVRRRLRMDSVRKSLGGRYESRETSHVASVAGRNLISISGQVYDAAIDSPVGSRVEVVNVGRPGEALYVPKSGGSVVVAGGSGSSSGSSGSGGGLTAAQVLALVDSTRGLAVVTGKIRANIATAGTGTGGLEFDSGGAMQIKEYHGLELTSNGLGINLDTNPGLSVGAGGLAIDLDTTPGLVLGAGGLSVLLNPAGSGLELTSGLALATAVAGSGLTMNATSRVMAVGAGNGIAVAADSIAIDLATNSGMVLTGAKLALGTPSAVTVVSTDSVTTTTHTHSITTNSNVGLYGTVAAVVLASTASGGLTLSTLDVTGSVDITDGGDLTVGLNVLFVDVSQESVGILRAPDPQFALDVNGPIRGTEIVGKHAIQLQDVALLLHFDGGGPYESNYTGEPNGIPLGQVPTTNTNIHYRPGKFYKAAVVGTTSTNLCDNPSFEVSASGWNTFNGAGGDMSLSRVSDDFWFGSYSAKLEWTAVDNSQFYQRITSSAVADNYSFGVWMRAAIPCTVTMRIMRDTAPYTYFASENVSVTEDWQYFTAETTSLPTAGDPLRINILPLGSANTLWVDGVQAEQRAGSTWYIDGSLGDGYAWTGTAHLSTSTRSNGRLIYSLSNMVQHRWTVMAWVCFASEMAPGDEHFLSLEMAGGERLNFRRTSSVGIETRLNHAGGNSYPDLQTAAVVPGQWYHLAAAYSGGTLRCYLDGDLIVNSAYTFTYAPSQLHVGFIAGPSYGNVMIDDICVSRQALSTDRVKAIVESDAPVFAESSVFNFRSTPKGLVWADEEGLWMRNVAGGNVLGAYGGDSTKSWGGLTLSPSDFLLGDSARGAYLLWDDSAGTMTVGKTGSSTSNVLLDGSSIKIRANTTERFSLSSAGVMEIKDSGGAAVFTFNASAGAEFTKPLTLGTSGGIYQGTGTFASPTTGLKMWNDGGVGRIAGYGSGTVQWYANTNGKLYAGAGNVILDANGLSIIANTPVSLENFPTEESVLWTRSGNNIAGISGQYVSSFNTNYLVLNAKGDASGRLGNVLLQAITFADTIGASIDVNSSSGIYVVGNTFIADDLYVDDTATIVGNLGIGGAPASGIMLDIRPDNTVTARFRAGTTGVAYNQFTPADASSEWGNVSFLATYALIGHNTGYLNLTAGGSERVRIESGGNVGINVTPTGKLHVDQSSTTAAIPVLVLDQADLSEEMIEFVTTVGAGNPIDTAAIGTYYGKVRVNVSGVGYKYIALYNT